MKKSFKVCDICKTETKNTPYYNLYQDFQIHHVDGYSTKINHSYNFNQWTTILDWDICPSCSKEKLEPFFKELGLT